MRPDICIYHGGCADGFTAAWAVWKRWPKIQFVAGVHGEPPPDVAGLHVLIVDFSYKRPVLERMSNSAASITILDHHKSAAEDLASFAVDSTRNFDNCHFGLSLTEPNIFALFDMERSGATMAWEFCHPEIPVPWLVDYVQDRDLWKFRLWESRAINAAIFSYPYDFSTWESLSHLMPSTLAAQGEAIERKHHKDIAELLPQTARLMVIAGHPVPVANLPYTMASDAANMMSEGNPFAACYFDRSDGKRVFSLRSKDTGLDVSEIAVSYGGGGHARAAGFTMPIGWEGDSDV